MLLSDKTERSGSPTSYLYLTLIFPPYSTSRKKCYRNDQFTAYSNIKTHISQLPLSDSWMKIREREKNCSPCATKHMNGQQNEQVGRKQRQQHQQKLEEKKNVT